MNDHIEIITLGGCNLKSCLNIYKDYETVFVKILNKQAPEETKTKIFKKSNC